MFAVETGVHGAERVGRGIAGEVLIWRSGNAAPLPLFPSFADAHAFAAVGVVACVKFGTHQPRRLRKECQQQRTREKLRTSETFAREIWTHKVEPSVLPCRRLFRRMICRECLR